MFREDEDLWIKEKELHVYKGQEGEGSARKIVDEKERVRALHWMRCPKCGRQMKTINNHEVLIDKCTQCGGLYFDKGEFEALVQMEVDDRISFFKGILNIFKR